MTRTSPNQVRLLSAIVAVAAIAVISGCAQSDPARLRPVTVLLDWTANPAHSGLLTAQSNRFDRSNGLVIKLRTPPSSSDGTRLLLTGRADLAVLDLHDLAIARERGRDLVAVMAVIGRPLSSLIAAGSISRPRELEGKTVAVSGAPSDLAVTNSIVRADGGDPAEVRIAQSGYAATQALVGGRAQAATGFLNEEGVTLAAKRSGFHVFPLERYGAPAYPELVLVATRKLITADPKLVQATVRALISGTRAAVANPKATIAMLQRRLPGSEKQLLAARSKAALSAMVPQNGRAGSLDPQLMTNWADWEYQQQIVSKRPDVGSLLTTQFSGR